MQIRARVTVTGEFDKLRQALVDGPANWMPGMYESPTGKITRLEADSPLGRLSRYARIRVGHTRVGSDKVSVPLSWRSLETEGAFPVFKGKLRLSRSSNDGHWLELDGNYEPPGGVIGDAVNSAALSAVAQSTIEDFVEKIASVLARNALGRSVDEQVMSGKLTLEQD